MKYLSLNLDLRLDILCLLADRKKCAVEVTWVSLRVQIEISLASKITQPHFPNEGFSAVNAFSWLCMRKQPLENAFGRLNFPLLLISKSAEKCLHKSEQHAKIWISHTAFYGIKCWPRFLLQKRHPKIRVIMETFSYSHYYAVEINLKIFYLATKRTLLCVMCTSTHYAIMYL